MKMHHATLKAAVLMYGVLLGTMPEQALKDTIKKDPKTFTEEDVNEIYEAILAENAPKETAAPAVVEAPQWAKDLLESNQSVIDSVKLFKETGSDLIKVLLDSNLAAEKSSLAVIESIKTFKDTANDIVKEIFVKNQETKRLVSEKKTTAEVTKVEDVTLDPEGKYVVGDHSFRDREDYKTIYEPGQDVSHLDDKVLKSLLSRGLIREA
jgi:hypothetical protein